jgi:hypothetical protein
MNSTSGCTAKASDGVGDDGENPQSLKMMVLLLPVTAGLQGPEVLALPVDVPWLHIGILNASNNTPPSLIVHSFLGDAGCPPTGWPYVTGFPLPVIAGLCAPRVVAAPDFVGGGTGHGTSFSTFTVFSLMIGRKGSANNIQEPNTMQVSVLKNKKPARIHVLRFFELIRSIIWNKAANP